MGHLSLRVLFSGATSGESLVDCQVVLANEISDYTFTNTERFRQVMHYNPNTYYDRRSRFMVSS